MAAAKKDPRVATVIQKIKFTEMGLMTITRKGLTEKFGKVKDKDGKEVKRYWMKSEKNLDIIWEKIKEIREARKATKSKPE